MVQLHSVPSLQKPTLSAQVARHLLDLITQQGLGPAISFPSEVQICKRPAGEPRQRARGVPHPGGAGHPGNRERPPSAAAVGQRACARTGLRLCAEDGAGERDACHRDAPGDRSAGRAARGPQRHREQKRSLHDLVGTDALGARRARSRAPHCSRHGDSHDARGSELQSPQSAAAGRAARAARAGDAHRLGQPPYRVGADPHRRCARSDRRACVRGRCCRRRRRDGHALRSFGRLDREESTHLAVICRSAG